MNKEVTSRLAAVESFPLALEIVQKLVDNGHTAYFAGGSVRDAWLGLSPKDIDIATTALPDQIEHLFPHTVPVGKKFGIIIVVQGKYAIEVATFRKESNYRDGRRPEHIEYSGPEEDSVRRDFTVNALFYDPLKKEVIDFQNGIVDLKRKQIRCVGNPDQRFSEDYLRILRCFRFALVLDFEIDAATLESALKHREGLKHISNERKRDELLKAALNLECPWKLVCEFCTQKLWHVYGLPDHIVDYKDYLFKSKIGSESELLIKLLWTLEANVDLKLWLKEFKCSTEVRQLVLRSLEFRKNIERILEWSDEEMHFFSYKNDLRLVLTVVDVEMSSPFYSTTVHTRDLAKRVQVLKSLMANYASKPVKPVVSGDDLKSRFQGVELGRILDLLLRKQLVFKWTHRDDALRWLDTDFDKRKDE